MDSCCATDKSCRKRVRQRKSVDSCTGAKIKSVCAGDTCCKPAAKTKVSCCDSKKPGCGEKDPAQTKAKSCADSCYAAEKVSEKGIENSDNAIQNVEGHGQGTEHVVLSISGMTCTGCETKLNRTLATVSGVRNLKTSLVLSRAEFDVDLNNVSVAYVMKHLERTTEFKCEIINTKGSSIDVIVSGDPSRLIDQAWPDGVLDMAVVDKGVIRISFDPDVIGARDLVEKRWPEFVNLAPVCADPGLAAGSKHVRNVGLMTLLSAVLTIPVLVMAWAPLPEREIAYGSASLALATLVQFFIAGPFYPKALKALIFSRVIEMDLLIVLSTSAAYIFSVVSFGFLVSGKPLSTGQFFETSTLLVTLIMVGRYVAALARQKAVESISIRSLQAQKALVLDENDSSVVHEMDTRLLQYGDSFKVLPDTKIPTDGTVTLGSSEVDESMLTGESLPVVKEVKSRVIAGTINGSGTLIVQLNRLPGDNTITTIAAMVDEAKLSKPKMQELADKVASYFVPVVVMLATITFVIWIGVGVAKQNKSGSEAAIQAITYAITVLIVSCPCAIGLAVPMVVVIASGIAAERGVIFKSVEAIEIAHKTTHVVLDKTGTLTEGKLAVVAEQRINELTMPLLLGLIGDSKHPVSVAVANHLRSKGVTAQPITVAKSLTGKGIQASVNGWNLQAGNSRWLGLTSHPDVQSILAQNHTAFCFTIDGDLAGVFGLADSLRSDAADVVARLHKRNVTVHIVSGDDDGPVTSTASALNIPSNNTRSRASPADKQQYIQTLLNSNAAGEKKQPIVVFCGDGTNDAVALAQATIGVHMNHSSGSDVAQSAADVVLMRPALGGLLSMIQTSKVSVHRIWFNFGWSFVYNTFAVLLAAGAFVKADGVRIPPEFAGLGELVSVLPVIAAAVLLRWAKI
jgi:Cu2+-exporting ATPase